MRIVGEDSIGENVYAPDLEEGKIDEKIGGIKICSNCEVLLRQMNRDKQHIKELEEQNKKLRMVDTRHGVELVDRLERAENKVKELEAILAKIKSNPMIGKLEVQEWPESPDY